MKKTALIVLGLCAMALVLSPVLIGRVAQWNIQALVERIDNSELLKAELIDYQSGFSHSHGKILLGLEAIGSSFATSNGNSSTTTLSLTADHGPLTRDGLGLMSMVITFDDAPADYSATLAMNLLGETNVQASIPPFSLVQAGESFNFAGLDIALSLSQQFKHCLINGNLKGLEFTSKELQWQLMLADLTAAGSVDLSDGQALPLGEIQLSLPAMELSLSDDAVKAKNMAMLWSASTHPTEQDLLDSRYQLSFSRLDANNNQLPAPVMDFAFALHTERLKKSSLREFYTQLNNSLVSQQEQLHAFGDIFSASPKLNLETFKFFLGDDAAAQVSADAALDGQLLGGNNLATNPLLLIGALEARVDGMVDESIYTQFVDWLAANVLTDNGVAAAEESQQVQESFKFRYQQQLETMIQQGMLNRVGGALTSQLEYKNGVLKANGEQVPFF